MRSLLEDRIYKPATHVSEPALHNVILTRFNLYYPGLREKAGVETLPLFEEWTRERVAIFLKICLPSMLEQTRKPDLWVIAADAATRDVMEPMLAAIEAFPWIKVEWQQEIGGVYERPNVVFARALQPLAQAENRNFITSRIDSDDGLNREFCEAAEHYAQAALAAEPELTDFWMSFPFGLQYDGKGCRVYMHPRNHFLSRFERNDRFRKAKSAGALEGGHGRVFDHEHVFLPITRYPMWMQYVHGTNVSNVSRASFPLLAETQRELSRFGLRVEGVSRNKPAERA